MRKLRRAGEILREERRKQGKSVFEVARTTKIRVEVLRGIEKGDFSRVKSFTAARGLIGNYAKELGLEARRVIAVFRRDFVVGPKGDVLVRGLAYPLDRTRLAWTPRLTIIVAIAVVVAVFGGYLGYQYWRASSVPPVEVETPLAGEKVFGNVVEVVGKTRPEMQVKVNLRTVVVDEEGNFETELWLPEGVGEIRVEVVSRGGRVKVVKREVQIVGE